MSERPSDAGPGGPLSAATGRRAGRGARNDANRQSGSRGGGRLRRLAGLALVAVLPLSACGGDGVTPPPPPPPPPLPPPPPGPPPPGASLSLELGELQTLSLADQTRSFVLEASAEPREYLVALHSAARGPGSFSLRLRAQGPEAEGASAAILLGSRSAARAGPVRIPPELDRDLPHTRLRESMRRELRRLGPRPALLRSGRPGGARTGGARTGGDPPAARYSTGTAGSAVPQVGDSLDLKFAVQPDLSVSCETFSVVRAVVRAVGQRFVLVEDTVVKDGFSQADWDEVEQLLDDITFPVDSAYFGAPADIDDNDRALVFFTAEVNELTEPGSGTFIGGLFFPGDLVEATPISQGGCPASNEAEILYVSAPDPNGEFGPEVDVERARGNARSVTTHEFQHLLTTEQRVILGSGDFGDLEDAWLSEGLAHLAEEVVGLKAADLGTRENLGLEEVGLVTEERNRVFNIHHLDNFFRLGFHLEDPETTQAFGEAGGGDPGGAATLQMRGNSWIFLRWLGDQFAPASPQGIVPGSAEHRLFQELSTGGPNHITGIDNILRAIEIVSGETPTWGELVADFEASLIADDNGPSSLPGRSQVTTWNLRDMYEELSENSGTGGQAPFTAAYPLQPTNVAIGPNTSQTVDFTLNAFTSRYLRFTSSGQPAVELVVEVTNSAGTAVTSAAVLQITVVRVQ